MKLPPIVGTASLISLFGLNQSKTFTRDEMSPLVYELFYDFRYKTIEFLKLSWKSHPDSSKYRKDFICIYMAEFYWNGIYSLPALFAIFFPLDSILDIFIQLPYVR